MSEFVLMALAGIITSNVITGAGFGAISLQSEKRNFLYMVVSMAAVISATIIAGLLFSVIQMYVLIPLKVTYLSVFAMAIICTLCAYVAKFIVKIASREMYFLYEKSYQFAIQIIVMMGILFLIDYTESYLNVMFQLAMFCVGFMVVQLVFYPLYEKLDNNKTLKPARNIPLMLYTLSIVAIIVSAICMMFHI